MVKKALKPKRGYSVFAVHKWETADGVHHDVTTFYPSGRNRTKRFLKWPKAEAYARSEAKRLGLKRYKVDTPQRPHVMVNV